MARGRHRVKIAVRAPFVRAEWEWIGFRSGASFGALNTTNIHELIPPIADNTVGIQAFTVHRIVGTVQIRQQTGVFSASAFGVMVGVEDAGLDQVSDNPLVPLSTDIDHMAHKGIMFAWVGWSEYPGPLTTADITGFSIPLDIKVKRIIAKRERLVIVVAAEVTARLAAIVNVRALIKESAGS